ncbi:MAG TPA: hypothetical protein DCE01_00645 [Thermodesulfobacterium commune]|uniref:Uncharacterized protein n=1 Tax=Thermodesulfobacterium commune TaxID=1741 RepID=A0A3B8N2C3_9BACT|nr:hypothetical protein [Thermodesulfobacterium commune]
MINLRKIRCFLLILYLKIDKDNFYQMTQLFQKHSVYLIVSTNVVVRNLPPKIKYPPTSNNTKYTTL